MGKRVNTGDEIIVKKYIDKGRYFTEADNMGYTGFEYQKIRTIVTGVEDKFFITKKGKFHKNLLLEKIDNQLSLF